MTSTPMRILLLVLLAVPLGAQTKANFVVILSDDQSWGRLVGADGA